MLFPQTAIPTTETDNQSIHSTHNLHPAEVSTHQAPEASNIKRSYPQPRQTLSIMASISTKTATHLTVAPPTTAEAFAAYSEDITRAIMTAAGPKPAKLHHNFINELPPAPPPSPVSFAIDSNGKPNSKQHSKIPSMSLE